MTASVSTKEKITNGFISLLTKRYFSEIKAVDIIKESNVSHQTFYRLFTDKYQLAETVCLDMFYRFQSVYGENASWKDLSIALLNIIKNNPRFFKHLTDDLEGAEIFRHSLQELSRRLTGSVGDPPVYYIWLCIVNEWAVNKFQDSVPEIYQKLCSSLPISEILSGKELEQALQQYEQRDMRYYFDKSNT
ncbi:MAG: hypothetical protein K2O73_08770 [Lachnospiraceae bacterium]|nr:hypothetical protein [Lachnospiraceae bacterium]